MIRPDFFIESLRKEGVSFYAGVPDSLLKNICAYITDHFDEKNNIITANEGGAVALAAGYHLSTGNVGCVYMQNSGEGNAINPLASLTDGDVYRIPLLLLIGWRGRPGVHDEPQHVKQGKVTTGLLDTMGIGYEVLAKEEDKMLEQIGRAMSSIRQTGTPYALVIEKDTFETYVLKNVKEDQSQLSREQAIQMVVDSMKDDDIVVSSTGMISRELFEYREAKGQGHERDFLTVGSMGHASMIALGVAMQHTDRRVFCFDGDGAAIMHMGNMAIVAKQSPANFVHVVFNNGAHDSVGGQPTAGFDICLPGIALQCGYRDVISIERMEDFHVFADRKNLQGPVLLEIRVCKGNRKDLGRPTTTPIQNKEVFMKFVHNE